MKKNKVYVVGMLSSTLALALVFGMVLLTVVSCEKKSSDGSGASGKNSGISFTRQESGLYKINGIQIYDGDMKVDNDLELLFYPEGYFPRVNALGGYIIYWKPENWLFPITEGGSIGSYEYLKYSIDKSIEWSDVAVSEKITDFKKEVPQEEFMEAGGFLSIGLMNDGSSRIDIGLISSIFLIDEGEGFLVLQIGRVGGGTRFFLFKDKDLLKVKEAFSEEFWQKILTAEAEYQSAKEAQDSKFN